MPEPLSKDAIAREFFDCGYDQLQGSRKLLVDARFEQLSHEGTTAMLLRVMRQICEVANETDVRWEARLYQIKVWSEKAVRIAEGK